MQFVASRCLRSHLASTSQPKGHSGLALFARRKVLQGALHLRLDYGLGTRDSQKLHMHMMQNCFLRPGPLKLGAPAGDANTHLGASQKGPAKQKSGGPIGRHSGRGRLGSLSGRAEDRRSRSNVTVGFRSTRNKDPGKTNSKQQDAASSESA